MESKRNNMSLLKAKDNLKMVLQKMHPSALSVMREASPTANTLAVEEAKKRGLMADGSRIVFHKNKIQVERNPEAFAATSLVFQKDDKNKAEAVRFWRERMASITPFSVFKQLAGMKIKFVFAEEQRTAQPMISVLEKYKMTMDTFVIGDSAPDAVHQLIDHFQPREIFLRRVDYSVPKFPPQELFDCVAKHMKDASVQELTVCSYNNVWPATIMRTFAQNVKSDSGARVLNVLCYKNMNQAPVAFFTEMMFQIINISAATNSSTALLRYSKNGVSRHMLLERSEVGNEAQYSFYRIKDIEDLLKMLSIKEDFPRDEKAFGKTFYSPDELTDFMASDEPWMAGL